MKGLQDDLDHQIRYNKKHGGPSEALKRMKKRPETRRDGRHFTGDMKPASWLKGKKWGWKPK